MYGISQIIAAGNVMFQKTLVLTDAMMVAFGPTQFEEMPLVRSS